MTIVFDPTLGRAFVQLSGFGHKYVALPDQTTVEGPSGGGFSSESDWTGTGDYVGSRVTGNPDRITFNITTRYDASKELKKLGMGRKRCYFNILTLYGCAPTDVTTFVTGRLYIDSGVASWGPSDVVVQGMEKNDPKTNDVLGADAALVIPIEQVAHSRTGIGATANAVNDVIPVNILNCGGDCGEDNDGDREFIAVGSPTGPSLVPKILYTDDAWTTSVVNVLTGITDGNAVSVARNMNRVLIAVTGTSAGLYAVPFNTIKTAGTLAVVPVNGISVGTAVNRVISVGNNVLAVGDAGAAWISTDYGYTFTALTTGSVADFLAVGGSTDENLLWFGGVGGALFRLRNGNLLEAVVSGTADDILTIAVPQRRSNELFFGTDAGDMFKTSNAADTPVTWTEYEFDKPTTSSVVAIGFGDFRGAAMYFVQNNGSSQSRVFRDLSSGNGGAYAIPVGTFLAPANTGISAIAVTSMNRAVTVGAVNTGSGFIGRIAG